MSDLKRDRTSSPSRSGNSLKIDISYLEIELNNKIVSIPMVESRKKNYILGKKDHYNLLFENVSKWLAQNKFLSNEDFKAKVEKKIPSYNDNLIELLAINKRKASDADTLNPFNNDPIGSKYDTPIFDSNIGDINKSHQSPQISPYTTTNKFKAKPKKTQNDTINSWNDANFGQPVDDQPFNNANDLSKISSVLPNDAFSSNPEDLIALDNQFQQSQQFGSKTSKNPTSSKAFKKSPNDPQSPGKSNSPGKKFQFDEYEKQYSKQLLAKEIQKVKDLEKKLKEKESELDICDSLKKINQQQISKNKTLVAQFKQVELEIKDDYKGELDRAERSLSEKHKSLNKTETKLKKINLKNKELLEDLNSAKNYSNNLKDDNERELVRKKDYMVTLEAKINDLEDKLADLNSHREDYINRNYKLVDEQKLKQAHIEKKDVTIGSQQLALKNMEQGKEMKEDMLEKEIQRLKSQLDREQENLRGQLEKLKDLHQNVSEAKDSELQQLRNNIMSKENGMLEDQSSKQLEYVNLIKEKNNALDNLSQENRMLKKAIQSEEFTAGNQANSNIIRLEKVIIELTEELSGKDEVIKDREQVIDSIKGTKDNEINKLRQKMGTIENKFRALFEEKNQYENIKRELEAKMVSTNQKYEKSMNAKNNIILELEENNNHQNKNLNEHNKLKNKYVMDLEEQLKQANRSLNQDLNTKNQRIEDLENQQNETNKNWNQNIATKTRKINELEEQIDLDDNNFMKNIKEKNRRITELEDQISNNKNSVTFDAETKNKKITELEKLIEYTEKSLNSKIDAKNKLISELTEQVDSANTALNENLDARINRIKDLEKQQDFDKKNYKQTLIDKNLQNVDLEKQVNTDQRQHSEALLHKDQRIQELEDQIALNVRNHQESMKTKNRLIKELEQQIGKDVTEINYTEDNEFLTENERRLKDYKDKITKNEATIQNLQDKVDMFDKDFPDLLDGKTSLENKITELHSYLDLNDENLNRNNEKNAKILELQSKLDDFNKLKTLNNDLRRETKIKDDKINQKNDQIKYYEDQNSQLTIENKNQLDTMRNDKNKEVQTLKDQLNQINDQVKLLSNDNDLTSKNELINLKIELDKKHKEVNSLKRIAETFNTQITLFEQRDKMNTQKIAEKNNEIEHLKKIIDTIKNKNVGSNSYSEFQNDQRNYEFPKENLQNEEVTSLQDAMNIIQGQIKSLSNQLRLPTNENLKTDSQMSEHDYRSNQDFLPKSLQRRSSNSPQRDYNMKPSDMEQRPSFNPDMPKLIMPQKHENYANENDDRFNDTLLQNMKSLPLDMTVGQFTDVQKYGMDTYDPKKSDRNRARDSSRYGQPLQKDAIINQRFDELQDMMANFMKLVPNSNHNKTEQRPSSKTPVSRASNIKPKDKQENTNINMPSMRKQFHNKNFYNSSLGNNQPVQQNQFNNEPYQKTGFERKNFSPHTTVDPKLQKILNFPESKYLFTSDDHGTLQQWSLSEKKLVHDWGFVHEGGVHIIASTYDQKYIFTASWFGHLKQWSINNRSQSKDYKKIHKGFINNLKISYDSKFLFTTSRYGYIKQISVSAMTSIKEYESVFESWIWAITVDYTSRYLFVTGDNGSLKQIDIASQSLESDWGRVNKVEIYSLAITIDNRFLLTGDENGWIKKWDINRRVLMKDFGQVFEGYVWPMLITNNNNFLYTCGGIEEKEDGKKNDKKHIFTKWSIKEGQESLVEKHNDAGVISIIDSTKDGKWIFTLNSTDGTIRQWSTEQWMVISHWGNLHKDSKQQCFNIV